MTASPWRLLVDGPGPGPWNMGVDEALFASAQEHGRATLRLYRWSGPWLSLGYGQALAPAREAACRAARVGVVRRVTGGRAVLHGADLTYALAAPASALPPGLTGSYRLVSEALSRGLARLGVAVERAPAGEAGAARRPGFDCFAEPAAEELLAGGRKLVGSAQRRAGGTVLQHGSIRLAPDPPAAVAAAGLAPSRATSLAELDAEAGPEPALAAIVSGFAATLAPLGVSLVPGLLSSTERQRALRRGARPVREGRLAS